MAKKKNTLKPVGTYAQGMQNNLTKKQNTVGAYSDRVTMLKNYTDRIKAQQEQKRAEEERQKQIRQQATEETRKMQTLSRDLRYGYGQKYDPALAYQAAQTGVSADKLRSIVEENEKNNNALNRLAKEAEALKDTGDAGIQKDRKNYNTGRNLTLDQFFRVQGKQRDNQAEGNLYVRMQGGYLRVMYPEPEVCLNLPAWQEFCGFDRSGQNAWFDIERDESGSSFRFVPAAEPPFAFGRQLERLHMIMDPEQVQHVPAAEGVPCDITGAPRTEETVLPGPFSKLSI